MAVAITAWKSTIIPSQGPSRSRGIQRFEIDVTQAAADNDCDIGDLTAGAFWTSAEAHATYGTQATALKTELAAVYPLASEVLLRSAVLDSAYVRVVGATAAATQYGVTIDAHSAIPIIAFHAASAPTAITLVFDFNLLEGKYHLTPKSYGTI
jgi:hypothetical protein